VHPGGGHGSAGNGPPAPVAPVRKRKDSPAMLPPQLEPLLADGPGYGWTVPAYGRAMCQTPLNPSPLASPGFLSLTKA